MSLESIRKFVAAVEFTGAWPALVALSGALLLGACGDTAGGDGAGMPDTGSAASNSGRTDGTLTVGDRTFAFRVTACDLSDAAIANNDATVRGVGRLDDETPFTVEVVRGVAGSTPIHSVAVNYGKVISGEGYLAVARRMQLATGWSHSGGGSGNDDAPLIDIDGRTVRASGTFKVEDAGAESSVNGRLDVTCP